MANFSGSAQKASLAVKAGGVEAVLEALRAHPANPEVQKEGLEALYRMALVERPQLTAALARELPALAARLRNRPLIPTTPTIPIHR